MMLDLHLFVVMSLQHSIFLSYIVVLCMQYHLQLTGNINRRCNCICIYSSFCHCNTLFFCHTLLWCASNIIFSLLIISIEDEIVSASICYCMTLFCYDSCCQCQFKMQVLFCCVSCCQSRFKMQVLTHLVSTLVYFHMIQCWCVTLFFITII